MDVADSTQKLPMTSYLNPALDHALSRTKSVPHLSLADVVKQYLYAARVRHRFQCLTSGKEIDRLERARVASGDLGLALSKLWMGLAAKEGSHGTIEVGFACHDGTYSMDWSVSTLHTRALAPDEDDRNHVAASQDAASIGHALSEYIIATIREYSQKHLFKFLGAGISPQLHDLCPQLPVRLWAEQDIVPIVLSQNDTYSHRICLGMNAPGDVDEIADSMARKCLMFYGPSLEPSLQIGHFNDVQVDVGGRATFTALEQYGRTVGEKTARSAAHYAHKLKHAKKKIAFFSATPQGGGVALMRHALLRFFRVAEVDCTWWVPRPKPEVFRLTKTNHNILQGVASPDQHFTVDQQKMVQNWTEDNARRLWARDGGPLAPRSKGGADVIIIDDPQMPCLITLAKSLDPTRPVIYRSHIQVRADLAADPTTNTHEVWKWVWSFVKHADVFISHPISQFVPHDVPKEKLGYMPATTDWLDGLNKHLPLRDAHYYLDEFNQLCRRERMTTLAYPKRDYIIQIARFDPAKGIPDALAAYAQFRRRSTYCAGKPVADTPQLVLCGHSSIDDPDGVPILNQVLASLDEDYADLKDSIVVMRLNGGDQMLNTLLSNAKIALQLSTREGFEIKVSEALHKGIPVIARDAGGIPLQVSHGMNGFLVHGGDRETEIRAVAEYLDVLFGDAEKYQSMSEWAKTHISDEVGTVGNAVCWMFLAEQMASGKVVRPNGRWIWDMAREEAGERVGRDEVRLPRHLSV